MINALSKSIINSSILILLLTACCLTAAAQEVDIISDVNGEYYGETSELDYELEDETLLKLNLYNGFLFRFYRINNEINLTTFFSNQNAYFFPLYRGPPSKLLTV